MYVVCSIQERANTLELLDKEKKKNKKIKKKILHVDGCPENSSILPSHL